MWKFKSLKGRDKWLFLLTIGVILCILAFPSGKGAGASKSSMAGGNAAGAAVSGFGEGMNAGGDENMDGQEAQPAAGRVISDYGQALEDRVKEILKGVEGVGEVEVMIVMKSSAEKIIQVDNTTSRSVTQEQDTEGGTRSIESQEQEHSTVLTGGSGSTGSGPIVTKEVYPEISGIVISASGGGNPAVQAEISAAMEALFGLPAHKIKVLKRVE